MVENQVIAGAVAHHDLAVPVQKVAPGGADGGDGGVGRGVIGVAVSLDDLQVKELPCVKRKDHTKKTEQHRGAKSAYSFHVFPPICPMRLIRE